MAEYATRLTSGQDTAPRLRLADTLSIAAGSGPLQGRGGLRPDGGGSVTVVNGSMQVDVTPFLGWIDGQASVEQGGYCFVLDATKRITLDDGSGLGARTDTICARVRDNAFDNSGVTAADVTVVKGIPGGGAPTIPAGLEPLRDVVVPANASLGGGGLSAGNLGADRRRYTSALGGVIPVTGTTQRAQVATEGQVVWRQDTKALEVHDGSGWRVVSSGAVTNFGLTWATGFGASAQLQYKVVGSVAHVRFSAVRTGSDVSFSAAGNTVDMDVATNWPTAIRPSIVKDFTADRGNLTMVGLELTPAGVLTLTHGYPTSTWANGLAVTAELIYSLDL